MILELLTEAQHGGEVRSHFILGETETPRFSQVCAFGVETLVC